MREVIGVLSAIIGIFVFVTGINNLPAIWQWATSGRLTQEKPAQPNDSTPARPSKILKGEAIVQAEQGFSFALQKTTSENSGDILIGYSNTSFDPCNGTTCSNLGPVDFNELSEAPKPGFFGPYSSMDQSLTVGSVYCLRLPKDAGYVKMLVFDVRESELSSSWDHIPGFVRFSYVVQLNGTRRF